MRLVDGILCCYAVRPVNVNLLFMSLVTDISSIKKIHYFVAFVNVLYTNVWLWTVLSNELIAATISTCCTGRFLDSFRTTQVWVPVCTPRAVKIALI